MARPPRVIFVVPADSHKRVEAGKYDAFGIFTQIFVWALPATRAFSVVIGIDHLPVGRSTITFWHRMPSGRLYRAGTGNITHSDETPASSIVAQELLLRIPEVGQHELLATIGAGKPTKQTARFPLLARKLPWPAPLEGDALKRALADPDTIKSGTVVLKCGKCETKYTFEVSLDPQAKLSKGARKFPASGRFHCPKCKTVQYLKDFEGQLRSNLGKSFKQEQS